MSKELPWLKYHVGQTKRAEVFRQWTCSLYYVLQQETLTSRIIDDRGIINYGCNAPWFALKAAALTMLAKLSESMQPHIREADLHDPISIMQELKLTCGGINTTTIADQKSKFQALLIGENESATNFLTRALQVFDNCVTFGIHYSEEDYVDKIIHALRGNQTYQAERGRLLDRRRMEQQNSYRSHQVEPLTVREIVHIMNNVDGEIYEGSVNRPPRRQRNDFNNHRNN
jgi:hypothetical protein